MAKTTSGFEIPEYTDKADIPTLAENYAQTAEGALSKIAENLNQIGEQVSSFSGAIAEMQSNLGALSTALDEVNGVTE